MLRKLFASFALVIASASAFPASVQSAEITFFCGTALRQAMNELIPEFQKESGHTVKVSYGLLGEITERIRKDEQADFATVSPQQWEALQKDGKLNATRTAFAKVGIGVFVAKGAKRPDLTSVEAFKRALLDARSIAVPIAQANPVAVYAVGLFERLGITAEMKAKNKVGPGLSVLQAGGRGEAEIGFTQLSEVIAEPMVDFVGPLPAEIQNYTIYIGAVPKNAQASDAVKAFLDFLMSAKAAAVFKAKGYEQG